MWVRWQEEAHAWFAALGEPLTDGDRADADAYAKALGLGALVLGQAHDWPEAERVLKAPDWSPTWWDREEVQRRRLLAEAEARYPERALWTSLAALTTELGDTVHGKAGIAAARMGEPGQRHRPGLLSHRPPPRAIDETAGKQSDKELRSRRKRRKQTDQ